jgi:two-component system chemotaxis response regulator CheY
MKTRFIGGAVSDSTARCNVLIVEDHDDTRYAIEVLLKAGGYVVSTAADGEEALASLLVKPCDLLLTDLWMPELGGEELIEAIRAQPRYRALDIVLMTASGEDLSRFGRSIQGTIRKPFSAVAIFEMLSKLHCHPPPIAIAA